MTLNLTFSLSCFLFHLFFFFFPTLLFVNVQMKCKEYLAMKAAEGAGGDGSGGVVEEDGQTIEKLLTRRGEWDREIICIMMKAKVAKLLTTAFFEEK